PQNHLSITRSLKIGAGVLQVSPDCAVVIDLSVINDAESTSTIPHRLAAGRKIDNAESTHPKREILTYPGAVLIGSAMSKSLIHRCYLSGQPVLTKSAADPDNTAHKCVPVFLNASSITLQRPAHRRHRCA